MASRVGMIVRGTAARDRTDKAVATIVAGGLEGVTPEPPADRDAELRAVLREEWLADVLEQIAAQGVKAAPKSRATKKDA